MAELSPRVERSLLGMAILLLALRFLWLGDACFPLDEPMFQMLVQDTVLAGKFTAKAFGGSSLPVPYGATALYLYAIPHLITKHHLGFVFFHTFIFTLASLFFYWGTRIWLGKSVAALALLFSATSPFMFFYARHPWDNTFLVTFATANYFLLISMQHSGSNFKRLLWHSLGLALINTLCINLHLMSGPLVLATTIIFLLLLWRSGLSISDQVKIVIAHAALILFVSAPYLLRVYRDLKDAVPVPTPAGQNSRWGDLRNFWWIILRSLISSSVWNSKIFLEPVDGLYFEMVGKTYEWIFRKDWLGWVPKALSLYFLCLPLSAIWRRPFGRTLSPAHLFCFLLFAITLVVYQFLNIPMGPHYFQSSSWLVFLGSSAVLLGISSVWWRRFLSLIFAWVMLVNVFFILSSTWFIHINKGTRGMNHGTVIDEVQRTAEEICEQANAKGYTNFSVYLGNVFTADVSLQYFLRNLDNCGKKQIWLSRSRANMPTLELRYPEDSKTDADLIVVDTGIPK